MSSGPDSGPHMNNLITQLGGIWRVGEEVRCMESED